MKLDLKERSSECFKYLDSISHKNDDIDQDVKNKIQCGWIKWRDSIGILCGQA